MTSYPSPANSVRLLERPSGICWTMHGPDFHFKYPKDLLNALVAESSKLTPEGKAKFDAACASFDIVLVEPDSKGRRWIVKND
jgi:hypothetical protein